MKKLLVLLLLVFTLGAVGQEKKKNIRKIEKAEILSPFKKDSVVGVAKTAFELHRKLDSVNSIYKTNYFKTRFYFNDGKQEIRCFSLQRTILQEKIFQKITLLTSKFL